MFHEGIMVCGDMALTVVVAGSLETVPACICLIRRLIEQSAHLATAAPVFQMGTNCLPGGEPPIFSRGFVDPSVVDVQRLRSWGWILSIN